MVREEFHAEPDGWQVEALREFAKPGRKRISMQACAGPGKSAVLAWMGLNFLMCYGSRDDHPKGAAVATTERNLQDNLWPEYFKWMNRSPICRAALGWNSKRLYAKDHPETWWISARSWSKKANADEQGAALSGLHSQFIHIAFDESADIPLAVGDVGEQALSNCTWGCLAQAGNPLSRDGMLYAAASRFRHQWHQIAITGDPDDPARASRVDIDWAREQIEVRGRDNPWVMAKILGQFPRTAINALLSVDEVEDAMKRSHREDEYNHAAKVLGVDVAREGLDNSVIFPRQGLVAFEPEVYQGVNSIDGAGYTGNKISEWDADACFIDDTGGFGAGWIDQLRVFGFSPVGVHFAGKAGSKRYANKRAEMWLKMAEWVKDGGQLPNEPKLVAELTAPTYTHRGDALLLEPKDSVRDRLGRSPDLADALALTFAHPVSPRGNPVEEMVFRGGRRRSAKRKRDAFYDI